jgi:hypothetical protein
MKLQEVEWFAERRPSIALQARAADRKRLIAAETAQDSPLWREYTAASEAAETAARISRTCGDYPLLSAGDINLYSLFVERAQALVRPGGIVGLLTPSGIAADKGAAAFFRTLTVPDTLLPSTFGGGAGDSMDGGGRAAPGAAAEGEGVRRAWPLRYVRMFDMTNDSRHFLTAAELERQGFRPGTLNRWVKGEAQALPLYEGKMVQRYDHRAAEVQTYALARITGVAALS